MTRSRRALRRPARAGRVRAAAGVQRRRRPRLRGRARGAAAGRAGRRDRRLRSARGRPRRARAAIGHVFVDLQRIHETATVDVDDPIDLTTLPWPEPSTWIPPVAASGLVPARIARCGWRAARSTSTATGARSSRSPPTSRARAATAPAPADGARWTCSPTASPGSSAARPRRQAEAGGRRGGAAPPGRRGRRPGTGKTTTVARIVALLEEQAPAAAPRPRSSRSPPRPARPRAARRGGARRGGPSSTRPGHPLAPAGSRPRRSMAPRLEARHPQPLPPRPRNRLPYDVVIVDETSMVSLSLMAGSPEAVAARPGPTS